MKAPKNFEYNPQQVLKMFAQFDEKSRRSVFRSALKKSSQILVKEARRNLKREIGAAASHRSEKTGKRLSSGIFAKVSKKARSAKVSIMKDYRLKFFELGTDERFVKQKGRYRSISREGRRRGRMKPTYFFRDAKRTTEAQVFGTIGKNLAIAINRINEKKYG